MLPNLKGYIYAAIAAAAYGTNPIFAIPLYGDGMDVTSVLVLRYAMAVVIMFLVIVCREKAIFRHFTWLTAKDWLALLGMGVLMVMSSILLFESYRFLSAGIASTLLFCYLSLSRSSCRSSTARDSVWEAVSVLLSPFSVWRRCQKMMMVAQ